MEVYVVTSGSYSDYTVEAVFLDKEKAECYAKFCIGDEGTVETFDTLDDCFEFDVKTVEYYQVNMDGDGSITRVAKCKYEHLSGTDEFKEKFKCMGASFYGEIIADTKKKAIKIMQDKRAEWLADKYGVSV